MYLILILTKKTIFLCWLKSETRRNLKQVSSSLSVSNSGEVLKNEILTIKGNFKRAISNYNGYSNKSNYLLKNSEWIIADLSSLNYLFLIV
jgi:hypothetical protein